MDLFKRKNKSLEQHEYCTRCQADLTMQKGYENTLPYWICHGCGEMLINPKIETEDNVVWVCDGCGDMLNIQPGFDDNNGEWKCTKCGFINRIDESELYASEDEFFAQLHNPYRGLSDEEVLVLSMYREEEPIDGRNDILRIRHRETGAKCVKKLLGIYNKSIYDYLKDHPIAHMPRIVELFEGSNCLVVIEEYVEGCTVAKLLESGPFPEKEAVEIVQKLCVILDELHTINPPIVHRDVKPSNILITPEKEVILTDVNVSKWADPEKTDDTIYMGTQRYAAPEQYGFGESSSSGKADIYAVGVLLNEMITGRHYKERRAGGRVGDIIKRCLSMEADDRYTAGELMAELEGLK